MYVRIPGTIYFPCSRGYGGKYLPDAEGKNRDILRPPPPPQHNAPSLLGSIFKKEKEGEKSPSLVIIKSFPFSFFPLFSIPFFSGE